MFFVDVDVDVDVCVGVDFDGSFYVAAAFKVICVLPCGFSVSADSSSMCYAVFVWCRVRS